MPEKAARLAARIEDSLAASRAEGVAAQVATTVLDFFLVPFALFLGARAAELGFFAALPGFLSAVSQFFVVDVLRAAGNRRRVLVAGTVLQALALAPLPALALLRPRGGVWTAFALVAAFRVVGAVMGPPWGSLMSDYLHESRRGRYFGSRSQLIGISGMVTAALFGVALQLLGKVSQALSFCLVMGAACAARWISLPYMRRMVEVPEHPHPGDEFDAGSFVARLRRSNFARFIAYVSGVTFATQVTASYFSVHMLRDLGFPLVPYTAVQLASAALAFGSYPAWGRHADLVGNVRVLRLNGFLLPLIPALWCLSERPSVLCAVEAASGFLWAGFNLCSTNFIYEAVAPAKRVRALGYYNLLNGVAVFLGGSLGSLLAERLPALSGYSLHALFLLGAALRFTAYFALAGHFGEVRASARHAGSAELFLSVVGLHPLTGASADADWSVPAKMGGARAEETKR
ncbi:MAG TPA: MFS transporter [Elusimicrobiota bacterium]|jgi:MFS family permease|nr:MFS transporter [Elusimicrobiota bacterium]